ncbi:MAG TPA: [FeFe] hydrogenase, group A [Armatimonadota bacterium]
MSTMVTLTIDERQVQAPAGTSIMTAAEQLGIRIPRLCFHPQLSIDGACRICVVEVEGMRKLVTSCSYPVAEGMTVRTTTPEIRQIRRDICELLLDNHPEDCQTCERDGNCELQRLAYSLGVRERLFSGEKKHFVDDHSSPAVIRNPDKCILCHRCVRVCAEIQGVTALGVAHRGFRSNVVPAHEKGFGESVCTGCGQCINVCPTAAFLEHNRTEEVWTALADPTVHTVVHFAPSVRAAIGEGWGLPPGTNLEGQIVTALRLLGFDRVFDTQFGADVTTVEEASELLLRLQEKRADKPLPMLTSCSAAWQKFIEQFYPEQLAHLTSTKSPMSIVSKLVRTYYAEKMGWDPASIFVVTAMCCTAKKWEAARPQLSTNGRQDTDVVITTRELVWMCKATGINLPALAPEMPDALLGESTGAGAIYGATGGVMESALRTAYALKFGVPPPGIEFQSVRGMEWLREAAIDFGGQPLRIAIANGLGAAHTLMTQVADGTSPYDYIEIMGCPGGCIGGGGQPYAGANSVPLDRELLRKRAEVLYGIDRHREIRLAHENPSVKRLYAEYVGEPLGEKAHALFHTHFAPAEPRGILPPALHATPIPMPPRETGCTGEICHERWDKLIAAVEEHRNPDHPEAALIPVLHAAQTLFGYLPQHVLDFVAYRVGVPAATVYGVATFYHHFDLTAQGSYRIAVCVGTACYINGGARILAALEQELGIASGSTTADGLFSLSEAHCIGACSLAPAVLINGAVHGEMTPERAVHLVTTLRMEHAEHG